MACAHNVNVGYIYCIHFVNVQEAHHESFYENVVFTLVDTLVSAHNYGTWIHCGISFVENASIFSVYPFCEVVSCRCDDICSSSLY